MYGRLSRIHFIGVGGAGMSGIAEVLVAAGAAEVILDRECDGERLAAAIRGLVDDPVRRAAMATRARALGRPDAAEQVAAECVRLIGGGGGPPMS